MHVRFRGLFRFITILSTVFLSAGVWFPTAFRAYAFEEKLSEAFAPGVQTIGMTGVRVNIASLMGGSAAQKFSASSERTTTSAWLPGQLPGPHLAHTPGLGWAGPTLTEYHNDTNSWVFPPDTMGAAGPSEFFVTLNSHYRAYNKIDGTPNGVNLTQNAFWEPVRGASNTAYPHVRFDRLSGRWFVMAATTSQPYQILLAVSDGDRVTTSTNWNFYAFSNATAAPSGDSSCKPDYPTLGIDSKALYVGVNNLCGSSLKYNKSAGFVIRKNALLSGGPLVVTAFRSLGSPSGGLWSPLGVDNFDPGATQGYFIGTDTATFGVLNLIRVNDPGGKPTISSLIRVRVANTRDPLLVQHLGNSRRSGGKLDALDDRLLSATIRSGRLWTVHTVGVDSSGTSSSGADRDGVRWYELQDLHTSSPRVVQWGTVYDNAAISPRSFWMPSIMVNGQGHAAAGFSYAGPLDNPGVMFAGRLASDPSGVMTPGTTLRPGEFSYNPSAEKTSANIGRRWGEYSYTSLDPCDDMSMWTIQEYASAVDEWGVWINKLMAPPPASPTAASPGVIISGLSSVRVTVSGLAVDGSAYYDPGAGFACRIAAAVPGLVVNSITYDGPTQVTLDLNTTGARPGLKDITITNPDGQSVTAAGLLTVISNTTTTLTTSQSPALYGDLITFTATVSASTNGTPSGAVHFYAGSTLLGSATLTAGAAAYTTSLLSAGSHSITAVYQGSALHDPSTSAALVQVINPAALTVTADDQTRAHGAPDPLFTYAFTGFVNGETSSVVSGAPVLHTSASASAPTGSYPIDISPGSLASANYAFQFVPGTLTITQASTAAALSITPNPGGYAQPITFQASITGQYPGGLAPTGTLIFSVDGTAVHSAVLDAGGQASFTHPGLAIGSHTVTIGYAGDSNYTPSSDTQTLLINKAQAVINLEGLDPTYTGAGHAVTVTTIPAGLTLQITYDGGASLPVKAGSYTVVVEIMDASYSGNRTATLTVHPADLTVTASSASKIYGAPLPKFTFALSGFVNGEDETLVTGSPSLTVGANESSPVGVYPVTPGIGTLAAENYAFRFVNGALTITQASTTTGLVLSPTGSTYGQPVRLTTSVTGQYSAGGAPGGQVSILVDGILARVVGLVNGQASHTLEGLTAGLHTITARYDGDHNHTGSSAAQTQQVSKASALLTLNNLEYPYDGAAHAAGAVTTPAGLAVTFTYNGSSSLPVKAGVYAVQATITDQNYSGSASGSLVIKKAHLTVTANAASKIYGAPLPVITYTLSGFVNNEGPAVISGKASVSTGANKSSPVGQYPITVGIGTLAAENYDFRLVNGQLAVTPAVLTITANGQTKIYGVPLPTFTASYSGFVLGESESILTGAPAFTTTATETSDVGEYPIMVLRGTLGASNYNFHFMSGTLTVTRAPTGTILSVSTRSAQTGDPITFSAIVIPGGIPDGGTVTLLDGNTPLQTLTLNSSHQASWVTDTLFSGTHIISARYDGSLNYAVSKSLPVLVIVAPVEPVTQWTILFPLVLFQAVP